MDEEFYYEEENPKKVIRNIIIILSIILIGVGAFIYYNFNYTLHIKKSITIEAGDELNTNLSYYVLNKIKDEKDYKLFLDDVTQENGKAIQVGTYKYTVTYKKVKKTGTIRVIDTTKPVVVTQNVTVGINEEYEADDFIELCEDYSKPCEVLYKDKYEGEIKDKAGSYVIDLVVSDISGNKTNVTAKLIVKEGYSRKDLYESDLEIASYSDSEVENLPIVLKFSKAVDDDLDSVDEYNMVEEFLESDLHNYLPDLYKNNRIDETELIFAYNKYKYVVGIGIKVKLDNGEYHYLEKK